MSIVTEPIVLSASTIASDAVRNKQGEDLGKIIDLMIYLPTGQVAYAVLSFGGFLGLGDKLFAVPWSALKLQPHEHKFLLDADKESLRQAPGFDPDNWPDMADESWQRKVHTHYRVKPYWEQPQHYQG
jgi:PRC-barrel domain